MTEIETTWHAVTRALMGTWPSQVASWGREALAAYVAELQARGLGPEQALSAIRTSDAEFPPAAGKLAASACLDPDRPTFTEAYAAIYDSRPPQGGRGVLWTHGRNGTSETQAALDRAYEIHPLLGAFVQSYRVERLRLLEVDHDDYGGAVRRDLRLAWEGFATANAHRDAAALAAGRERSIGPPRRLDLAAEAGRMLRS